jgi:hypothetical protein
LISENKNIETTLLHHQIVKNIPVYYLIIGKHIQKSSKRRGKIPQKTGKLFDLEDNVFYQ